MTPPYTMHSVQRFTADGKFGVWLLMCSPLVSGASYVWLLHELAEEYSHNQTLVLPSVLLILSGLAFIAGALLALIGREQTTTVTSVAGLSLSNSDNGVADLFLRHARPNGSETYTDEANRRAARDRRLLREEDKANRIT